MANKYVRSTDGSDADDGSTWALADATLTGAAATDVAGDVIWVSQVHAESTAASITFNWEGTVGSPTRVLCGNDAAQPPTALATTGSVSTTGNNPMTISSGEDFLYVYGLAFHAGVGASGTASLILNQLNGMQIYENCTFDLATTGIGSTIIVTNDISGSTECRNCSFQFSATAQSFTMPGGCTFHGGSILADAAITTLIISIADGSRVLFEGFDFSNCASTLDLVSDTAPNVRVLWRNCKLPASWSGALNASTPGAFSLYELVNCDAADTNYRLRRLTQFGELFSETTVVRTGGASDGTTPLSWKMASNANTEWNHQTLDTGEIVRWNETTGSAITATIEFLHDSVTNMTDQQIWMEVQYLGTSGFPLGAFINDAAADYLAAAADQTASSAAWTTTGLTNPNKQKLSVTFTPQEKGFIHAIVKVAMASKTVFIDPLLLVT
jgi:hypothetical protein